MNRYKLYTKLLDKDFDNRKLKKKQHLVVKAATTPKPKISSLITKLKTQFEYTCDRCHKPIVYDTLFVDDFTGKYIPLDRETMRTHFKNCKSNRARISYDNKYGKTSGTIATLQSLSINLPRLAYQSNNDETYFRARLALMIKPALSAMSIRKKALIDLMRKGMLPTLASSTQFMQLGTSNIVINLTGVKE